MDISNKRNAYNIGLEAEKIVIDHLMGKGYRIWHQRWKSKYGEIDIIALNSEELLFIEVKAKKNLGYEQEIVSKRQQLRNSKAALDFIGHNDIDNSLNIRFDCFVITDKKIAFHIQNAWEI